MSRFAYVNGQYVRQRQAMVHVEDRGYQFADGVYEVMAIWNGLPVDYDRHIRRLSDGLEALQIAAPMSERALSVVLGQVIRRNGLRMGSIYIQITRGVAPRNHCFPAQTLPSLVVTARTGVGPKAVFLDQGIDVITAEEIRWKRRDIKSISLLPNILAKQRAFEAGAFEAWLIDDDDTVTEGSSSNAWIVDADGTLVTRPRGPEILPGVTRAVLIDLARDAGIAVTERPFSLAEAMAAQECMMSSTTNFVLPVVRIDGRKIGDGCPGPLARRLYRLYMEHLEGLTAETAWS